MVNRLSIVAAAALLGCGDHGAQPPDASTQTGHDASVAACNPPDVLVLLDRTASMAERPDGTKPANTPAGHAESKWFMAIDAVESLSAKLETTIRFGLALFPRAPAGCITLAARISGMTSSNPQCQAGVVLVTADVSTAAAIDSQLDPEATRLCTSTPIGAGLATVRSELAAIRDPSRDQYVLFVGDGADTCNADLALANTDALARDGVKTFVVAFDNGAPGGIDRGLLNDMACAGQTAAGFPAGCTANGSGDYRATDRTGAALFLTANDAAGLTSAFEQVAGSVCCGCIL
jgi:hypothetical protein